MSRIPIVARPFTLKSPRSVDEAVEAFDAWLKECRHVLLMNLTAAFDCGELDDLADIEAMLDEADDSYEDSREAFRRGLLVAINIAPAGTVH